MFTLDINNLPKNLTERQVRFLLDGHNHDGVNSAMLNLPTPFVPPISQPESLPPPGIRPATVVVAASDSSASSKAAADFVCDGTNDTSIFEFIFDTFNLALSPGGSVLLLEGTFTLTRGFDTDNILIEGMGYDTVITWAGEDSNGFGLLDQSIMRNLRLIYNHALSSTGGANGIFENLFYEGDPDIGAIIGPNSVQDFIVDGCSFNFVSGADAIESGGTISAINGAIISNSYFNNATVVFSTPSLTSPTILTGNYVTGVGTFGEIMIPSVSTVASNNIFIDCSQVPLFAQGGIVSANTFINSAVILLGGPTLFIDNYIVGISGFGEIIELEVGFPGSPPGESAYTYLANNYIDCNTNINGINIFTNQFIVAINNWIFNFTNKDIAVNTVGGGSVQTNMDGSANEWNITT